MFEEEKHDGYYEGGRCDTKAYQSAVVCIPVTISPFAKVGTIVTECCGKPVVSGKHCNCKGEENGSCKFTISQKIKVEIPVEFGANTTVGGTFVDCEGMEPRENIEEHKEYTEEH